MGKQSIILGLLLLFLASCTFSEETTWVDPEAHPVSGSWRTPTPGPGATQNPTSNASADPTASPSSTANTSLDLSKANGKLLDLSLPATSEHFLLALNKGGVAYDDLSGNQTAINQVTESVGTVPSYRTATYQVTSLDPKVRKDLASCPTPLPRPGRRIQSWTPVTTSDTTHTFIGLSSSNPGQLVPAHRVYSGTHCLIFSEDNKSVAMSQTDWTALGQKFDNQIYPTMIQHFGTPTDIDNNGRVIICYYEFNSSADDMYTLGYFYPGDLESPDDYTNVNGMEVFFLNLAWGGTLGQVLPNNDEMMRTLAHEFQHMINYGNRGFGNKLPAMDTWIDEGMAESAEQVVMDSVGTSRLQVLQKDPTYQIANGKPLTIWDGSDENYAQSYTFLQYCKNQSSDGDGLFKRLISAPNGDYRIFESTMQAKFSSFAQLSIAYRLANLIHGSGIYGYGSENSLFSWRPKGPTSAWNKKLAPGGAVYLWPSDSTLSSFQPGSVGPDVFFVRVNGQ